MTTANKPLSYTQERALRNLLEGRPSSDGCKGQSEFGGHERVMWSLRRRGLVENGEITDAGRVALGIKPKATNVTRARGQKRRGGVSSSHCVLHIPVYGAGARTWCNRLVSDVNCTPDNKPSVSRVDGDNDGHTYAQNEICKVCLKGYR